MKFILIATVLVTSLFAMSAQIEQCQIAGKKVDLVTMGPEASDTLSDVASSLANDGQKEFMIKIVFDEEAASLCQMAAEVYSKDLGANVEQDCLDLLQTPAISQSLTGASSVTCSIGKFLHEGLAFSAGLDAADKASEAR